MTCTVKFMFVHDLFLFFFFFSSRRRHTRYIGDWNSDVCSSDLIGESHVALATAEQRLEDRAEVLAHLPERLQEHPLRGLIDLARRLLQRLTRGYEVVPLRHQELEALHLLAVLVDGERIDRAHRVDRGSESVVLLSQ